MPRTIPEHILARKGARSLKDIDPEVLRYLKEGLIETKNLMEWLATEQLDLLKLVLTDLGKDRWYEQFEKAVEVLPKPTANSRARVISVTFASVTDDEALLSKLSRHKSDIVRCWACWALSCRHEKAKPLLKAVRPFAGDGHFGVHEVVIFAIKEKLIADLGSALEVLKDWILDTDENIRRFSVESMRPIGVWTKKIQAFQDNPEKGIQLIEPLKSDPSKYVRDSVGNWLNDAGKSNPEWVKKTCSRWEGESSGKETTYIVKRGMRTINK